MKKLISIFLALSLFIVAQAQTFDNVKIAKVTTTSYGNALDTVVNTATKTTTPFRAANWRLGVTAQVVVTKISGTVGGTLGLYGSMDGVNFTLIGSTSTPSDGSVNYGFNTNQAWYYYRVAWTGTGTMSASLVTTLEFY